MSQIAGPDLSVYLHWPFCLRKCPYCDFNSYASTRPIDVVAWRTAYLNQIATFRKLTGDRTTKSLFFGGGTPSLMPTELVGDLIAAVDGAWPLAHDAEITLEANPSSADRQNFAALRNLGVTRLSLGVQALDAAALRFLRRSHSAAQALRSLEWARTTFPEVSIDLIYGRPGQTVAAWRAEVAQVATFELDHLSVYQLTIEDGTAFSRETIALPSEDLAAELYTVTQVILADLGLPAYEISNHARNGHACRHNLAIWRGGDYVGIGPGAHGRLAEVDGARSFWQESDPYRWLADASTPGGTVTNSSRLAGRALAEELIISGLRLAEGISLSTIGQRAGIPVAGLIDMQEVTALVADGLCSLAGDGLRLTEAARVLLDEILRRLLVFDAPQLPAKLRCPSEITVT